MTNFDFDPADALSDDDFLTPVYFGREVLVKYLYDPRLRCDFASETYGQIFGEGFSMAFGINPNGHVVVRLIRFGGHVPKGGYDVPNGQN